MSEIDWDSAPAGCIGALVAKKSNVHHSKVTFASSIELTGCMFRGLSCEGYNLSAVSDCWDWVDRPSPAWSGDGLPPVGVRCEAAIPHTSGPDNERSFIWIEGSVIAYYEIKGKTYAWFAEDDGFYPPNTLKFRPIRTPEQIAADEREAAINEIGNLIASVGPTFRDQATRLYDAGYRKMEQPK